MKFVLASAMIGAAAAFSNPSFMARPSALKMSAVEAETYTFTKSEEIFAEAQEVSRATWKQT